MLNYTIRFLIWEHKADPHGRCPIVIVLTINRKKTYFTTPHKILVKFWDAKLKQVDSKLPNARIINADINKRLSDIENSLLQKSLSGVKIDSKLLKAELRGDSIENKFFTYAEELKRYKDGSQAKGSRVNYSKEINRFKAFAGSGLSINDIDVALLRKYESYERNRKMSQNTINTTFKWLRTVVTHAYKDGHLKANPFDSYTMPRYVQSERVFLEKWERDLWVKEWRDGRFAGSLYNTLTYFLLGVFTGLRNSDWASAVSMVSGDLLRLRPLKTRKSGNWVVLPIGPTLRAILDVVETLPPPISPEKTRENLKIIAGALECKKHVTTHVARHSFATMCAENRIPKSVTAELMGVTVDTVEVYFHLTGQSIAEQAAVLRTI